MLRLRQLRALSRQACAPAARQACVVQPHLAPGARRAKGSVPSWAAACGAAPPRAVTFAQGRRGAAAAARPRESQFLEVNGRRLHVVTSGALGGGVPVLCLPGAMGTAEGDFGYQLDGLAPHGVVSLDPRGNGQSRPPNRVYPADFYHIDADDAAGVMQALGCDSYHVVGWSDGAISATLLAAKYPELVRRLVVFGIQGHITQEDVDMYEKMRDVEKNWSKRMLDGMKAIYGPDGVQPMWDSFCDAMKMIHDAGGDFCQKEARTLRCPTLILHGEKDPIVPAHHPQWFHENIPGSRMHTFPGGKHNIHQKFSEEFNSRVLEFFAEGSE